MLKYYNTMVVFEEIPDKVSLAINITNCQNRCIGCHSPHLRANIGAELTKEEMDRLLKKNSGVNCVLFMGEGNDKTALLEIAKYTKEVHGIPIAIYSGRKDVEDEYYLLFDYVKVGPYVPEYGPLNNETTNQRLYRINHAKSENDDGKEDITYLFWKKK